MLEDGEILTARLIDRALRPLAQSLEDDLSTLVQLALCCLSLHQHTEHFCHCVFLSSFSAHGPVVELGRGCARSRIHAHQCGFCQLDGVRFGLEWALRYVAGAYGLHLSFRRSNRNLLLCNLPAAVRIGWTADGQELINPSPKQLQSCESDLLYAGTAQGVVLCELTASEVGRKRWKGKTAAGGINYSCMPLSFQTFSD